MKNKLKKIFCVNFILFFGSVIISSEVMAEASPRQVIDNPFGSISILKEEPEFASNISIVATKGDPEVQLIENPNRLIIDIPTDKKGKVSTVVLNNKSVKSIRIGQHTGKVRVVYDILLNAPAYQHSFDKVKGLLSIKIFSKLETVKNEAITQDASSKDAGSKDALPQNAESQNATPIVTSENFALLATSPTSTPSSKPSPKASSSSIPSISPSATPSSIIISKAISPSPVRSAESLRIKEKTKPAKDKVSAYTFKGGQVEIVEVPRTGNLSTIKAPKPSTTVEKSIAKNDSEKLIEELLDDKFENSTVPSPVATAEAIVELDNKQILDKTNEVNNVEQAISELENDTDKSADIETQKSENKEFDPVVAIENGLNKEMNLKPSFWEWLFAGLAVFFGLVFLITITYSRRLKQKLEKQENTQGLSQSDYLQDAYQLLNCREEMSDPEIKQKYKQLVKSFHSDQMESKDIPEEVKKLSEEQLKKIHAAYEIVKNARGF